ncbi:hypothetical protein [Streptomyces buecherae]|uniref:hypothetical protein n=1 Tax=Streptomyces buecherae TaxID=2763006 RepID=UPI00379EAD6A
MSPGRAGLMLGAALVVGVPSTFALLPLTRTGPRPRLAFVVLGASLTAGYLGLLCAPLAVPTLWAVPSSRPRDCSSGSPSPRAERAEPRRRRCGCAGRDTWEGESRQCGPRP